MFGKITHFLTILDARLGYLHDYVWGESLIQRSPKTAIQSGAPVYDSVQLVQITPMSLWFMVRK